MRNVKLTKVSQKFGSERKNTNRLWIYSPNKVRVRSQEYRKNKVKRKLNPIQKIYNENKLDYSLVY